MLKRIFKEAIVYGLSRYIGKLIGVFLLPLYTAALVPEDYGILNLLGTISLVSTFLIVSGTDSSLGYYYFRKEYFDQRKEMITSALWIRLLFSVTAFLIILLCSGILSDVLFGREQKLFIIITGATIVFASVSSFLYDLLRFEFKQWLYTVVSTAGILLNIGLSIYYVLILKAGIEGALIAGLLSYGLLFVFTLVYVINRYGLRFSGFWFKSILKYGFPLIGTGIAVWVLTSTDVYFLAHFSNLSAVGIYSVGIKVASFVGLVAGAIQLAWGPFAADIQFQENAKHIYAKVFLLYAILNIIGVFYISMFAIDILKVFTQPDYYGAKAVIPLLCLSAVISSGYFIVVTGMNLAKKLQHTIWITISGAAFNILLNYLLTPVYGSIGAAISITCANSLIFLLTLIYSQKYYPISFNYRKVFVVFIPAFMLVALTYYFSFRIYTRVVISVLFGIFAAAYFYFTFRKSEEFKKIIDKLTSLKEAKKPVKGVTSLDI
jgi:O-antigen/teichoic acid export membrane protein